jgi:DNA-binding GntR family transcriptional regulator
MMQFACPFLLEWLYIYICYNISIIYYNTSQGNNMEIEKKTSLSNQTYQLIKNDIVTCLLDPGMVIVQSDLAQKYETGVTPVREALRQLAQEGFVQPIPRMGYRVSPITAQDVEEIFEVRLILESSSARLAAERGRVEDLKKIGEKADFTYKYKDRQSYTVFLKHNADFHISIAEATLNQRLVMQVSKIMDELNRVFHLGLDLKDSAEEMRRDHLKLAEALWSRNPVVAEKLACDEIWHSRERVLEAITLKSPALSLSSPFRGSGDFY